MKVAIDLTPLYSEHQFRGIGFYTKRLVESLKEAPDREIELEFVKSIEKLRFIEVDLIHYPYFTPFFFSLPAKPLAPSIVTIHDLIPIKHLANFAVGVKGRIRWQIQKRRLKNVSAIITDSLIWRNEIAKLTAYSLEKIFSIPLAAGKEFKLIKDERKLASVKEKYQLPDKFILYIGDVNWNKNIPGLLRTFARLREPSLFLVLVGKAFLDKNLAETKEILQLIKELSLINYTRILGFVPTEDLVAIYNLATVYCQPSFDEGFGLPILEAMACGCPVVAAKAGSLPEICDQAAEMINPEDIGSINSGISRVINSRKRRSQLIELGFEQVKKYSWEKTAKGTIDVYKKVAYEK